MPSDLDQGQPPPTRRLVRIRIYLVDGGREVLTSRRYVKLLGFDEAGMPDTEAYLDLFLEETAVEDRDERPASDYRLELTDEATGVQVLAWRYSRPRRQQ